MDTANLLADLVARARRAGADAADAVLSHGASLSVTRRAGETEHLERAEGHDLGLRVFVGQRAAIVSATSVDPAGFDRLVDRAIAMAKVVPPDPFGGLAEAMAPPEAIDLDLNDGAEPEAATLIARAEAAEAAARGTAGITNTEGGEAGFSRTSHTLVTSAGFAGTVTRSSHSISAVAVAGTGVGMQRDYDYSSMVHLADVESPEEIGLSAAKRALARLDPKRPKTTRLTVIFDPRVASSLVTSLAGMVNGQSVARGTSLLKDKMGERVFREGVSIIDDPRRPRGPRSRPFDAEGVPTRRRAVIDNGILTTWLLDSRSARQLKLPTTGHAARSAGGTPQPMNTNLYMEPGTLTPAELMADIAEGLYVIELMGGSMNPVTGDYSRGAAGFMIRNGQLAEPVAEITIAGNGLEMFRELTPANDLRFRRGTDAPTIRIDGMTMAGA